MNAFWDQTVKNEGKKPSRNPNIVLSFLHLSLPFQKFIPKILKLKSLVLDAQ